MFPPEIYKERRRRLCKRVRDGVIVLQTNGPSPMNYPANTYPFRQDSSFLYYFGIDLPGLFGLIDAAEGKSILFGLDPTTEEVVWTGPQTPLCELAEQVGVDRVEGPEQLLTHIYRARNSGGGDHLLPPYRKEHFDWLVEWTGLERVEILEVKADEELIRAVVAERSVKRPEEIQEIERALEVAYEVHTRAMQAARPGRYEREVVGEMAKIVTASGGAFSFPPIFSIHGETLHNEEWNNRMKEGDIAVNDSGADSPLHYASDITRTIPIGGRFSQRQREIYSIVLESQERAIEAVRPGVEFRDVHRLAAKLLVDGLKELGLMNGDSSEAVEAGAHTLFFPCGTGHMMGLDVHDMEGLGEDFVGYTETIKRRPDFGWRSLRLARALEPGFVVTVEPGIYFIPQLIDRWKAEKKFVEFVDYEKVEAWRDFGGMRVEDDILVTTDGHRLLGKPIPKSVEDVEAICSE